MARKSRIANGYWSNAFITIAQVFFAVAVGTFFTGGLDKNKILVVIFNLAASVLLLMFGSRLRK